MGIVAAYAVPHPPLIIPEIGRGEERQIQSTIEAYREVARRIANHKPQTIVVTSPHAPMYRDCFLVCDGNEARGDFRRYGAPQVGVKARYDWKLVGSIMNKAKKRNVPVVSNVGEDTWLDQATLIPLRFINEQYRDYELVRIGLSGLSFEAHRALGQAIAAAVEETGRHVVLVASGDLSHKLLAEGPYGYAPEGPVFDERVTNIFASGNLEGLFQMDQAFTDAAAECGLRSFQIMAGALNAQGLGYDHELLSYEGPFGVGYGVAAFETKATRAGKAGAESQADPYVALARASVEGFVRTGQPIAVPANLPDELLNTQAGAFVSLHKDGELRGCIGTISPTKTNLAEEIIANGVSAAAHDPRFSPVRPEELDRISYSVDVLGEAESIVSSDELDPARYGVIVTNGWRRGLLLPDLEGVDTAEQQVAIALRKAGIHQKESYELQRFEVVRHSRGGEARCGR